MEDKDIEQQLKREYLGKLLDKGISDACTLIAEMGGDPKAIQIDEIDKHVILDKMLNKTDISYTDIVYVEQFFESSEYKKFNEFVSGFSGVLYEFLMEKDSSSKVVLN